MQALKVKEKLTKLASAPRKFSKTNVVFQTTRTFVVGSDHTERATSYETTQECRVYQLEAELLKAKAEEFAQNLRRTLV